jgi:hypothetical protein
MAEKQDGERLEVGATDQAVGSDPAMATVGAFNRSDDVQG